MKSLIILSVFVALTAAQFSGRPRRPQISSVPSTGPRGEEILIIRSESENNGDGTYRYLWETSEGAQAEESGYLKPNGNEDPIQVAQGSYQYYSPEGELIQLSYIADENGFQPQGSHIPTPPPVPAEIQRALDLIYSNQGAQQRSTPSRPSRPAGRRY